MDEIKRLTAAQCVLLAVHLASTANVAALRSLSSSRPDAFSSQLLLRILLTYLPESVDPSLYISYVHEIATQTSPDPLDAEPSSAPIDAVALASLPKPAQAAKRVKKLHLLALEPLASSSKAASQQKNGQDNGDDEFEGDKQDAEARAALSSFVVQRARRIDAETGLLNLVPALVSPFLDFSEELRTWFISVVLPLCRLAYEYYPHSQEGLPSLQAFERLSGAKGVEVLLARCQMRKSEEEKAESDVGRDIKGLVGPWMYGDSERKRRKLNNRNRAASVSETLNNTKEEHSERQVAEARHDWEHVYAWIVQTAAHDLKLAFHAIEEWDGPSDVDLGGYEKHGYHLEDDVLQRLERQYAQAAFAAIYAADASSPETIEEAHTVLARLSRLLDFEPPPELAANVELLPRVDAQSSILNKTTSNSLSVDNLLEQAHPLTTPAPEAFSLLQILVYSAYILGSVGHPVSVLRTAKLRFFSSKNEQMNLLQNILHSLSSGTKKDEQQWLQIRARLIWLWSWGASIEDTSAQTGAGIFGKIERSDFEKEIINALLGCAHYNLITAIYIKDKSSHSLSDNDVESILVTTALSYYDNASNGNRTRGSMKKAADILAAFRTHFRNSVDFARCEALIKATHALSFYSLILHHGVPFQPVNIRVSKDPVSLLSKVLDQNPRSYTKLDDLISIAKNFVIARLNDSGDTSSNVQPSPQQLEEEKQHAERRVIGMAVEAALAEDDFETAYSYVVNKLNPPSSAFEPPNLEGAKKQRTQPQSAEDDDLSWRSAFVAGRHRGTDISQSQSSATSSPVLRRLEQRMELLSQALLLAPPSALPEILAVWRRCEEEMTILLAQEAAEEEQFNSGVRTRMPGDFIKESSIQPRREVGRGAVEESPMGLFDVARGAATAFSKSAFPLRGSAQAAARQSGEYSRDEGRISSDAGSSSEREWQGLDGQDRVRKRDMVANAVTGSLVTGIGWVLGKRVHSST